VLPLGLRYRGPLSELHAIPIVAPFRDEDTMGQFYGGDVFRSYYVGPRVEGWMSEMRSCVQIRDRL
jgi:hypothetical protein